MEKRQLTHTPRTTRRSRSTPLAHLVQFLTYNFIGALLPLIVSWIARTMGSVPAIPGVYAPELLFFGIMISATALGDITDEARIIENTLLFQAIKGVLLFGAIGVAALYGMYQYDAIVGPGNIAFRSSITGVTLVAAVFSFLTSFSAEFLLVKIRGAAI